MFTRKTFWQSSAIKLSIKCAFFTKNFLGRVPKVYNVISKKVIMLWPTKKFSICLQLTLGLILFPFLSLRYWAIITATIMPKARVKRMRNTTIKGKRLMPDIVVVASNPGQLTWSARSDPTIISTFTCPFYLTTHAITLIAYVLFKKKSIGFNRGTKIDRLGLRDEMAFLVIRYVDHFWMRAKIESDNIGSPSIFSFSYINPIKYALGFQTDE